MERLQKQNKNHKNMETYSKCVDFPDDFPIQPIHPDKAIKEGDCPICRGDGIVKVFENGVQHYASCICNKHNEQLGKAVEIVERIRKRQKEYQKQRECELHTNDEKEIKYMPIHPDKEIKEGDCPICGGMGVVRAVINGVEYFDNCICTKKEIAMNQLKLSGIAESIEKYTFDKFQTPEEWQQKLKQKALHFLQQKNKWFFVGGQVGCGKTHICTAILAEFLKKGISVKYVIWTNEIVRLKANKMDDENYQRMINPLLTTQVLYIDDFFKTEKDKRPSEADIRTAFEIINYRYVNSNLITIFSTEKTVDDIIDIDEAIGSRIHEKTKGYRNVILKDEGRNWRLREEK